MTKFSADRFPAGFFDLSQDIVRSLPLGLIDRWAHSDQSVETARALLDPTRVECTVVSTDSVGLTTLTRTRGLIEILALINRPKELVHAWGTAAGGAAVGVWAADNTQMFYPAAVPAGAVLSMLLAMVDDIDATCEVRVGAAVHSGSFFLLGGGLYGADADRVENLAEEHAGPGEILATPEFAALLGPDHRFQLCVREGLPESAGAAHRVADGPRVDHLEPEDWNYPIPYSQDFYADLKDCYAGRIDRERCEEMRRRYCRSRAVVLIEREREESEVAEIEVLNELALSAAMARLADQLLRDSGGSVVKIAGPLGIFTFGECYPAVVFARRFREAFLDRGIRSRIGVDVGDVLMFELGGGLADVAGMPVNLASKLAQDKGEYDRIYLTESALASCPERADLTQVTLRFGEWSVDAWVE
ncbi:MAG: hypothetical protein KIT09_18030 [Bryobacteraceae bacterium]|nr:hypothetical protein [Bryobacteraceae bacterium]